MSTTYTIFGAGPGGLYTAWRLATGGTLKAGDAIELIEWGDYSFDGRDSGTRLPAGRICSYHYRGDVQNSYIELGGMRFIEWDPDTKEGHQMVTTTVKAVGLESDVVPFLTTDNPLYYLRGVAYYQDQLTSGEVKAPYNTGANTEPSSTLVSNVSALATNGNQVSTRPEQCSYYSNGELHGISSVVYNDGDNAGNIGYWNFLYDQAGNEGYRYATAGGGYNSNTINWNCANASVYNGEFAPGGTFKTLKSGYSQLFVQLYQQALQAAQAAGVELRLTQQTRLHSIWLEGETIQYRTASAADPDRADGPARTTDYAFLAMPRHAVELVGRATRYADMSGKLDFLNDQGVQNYLESVITQPSYKIAMFFDRPWWNDTPRPPKLVNNGTTDNVFGPTITDLPLRQVYYFGDNSQGGEGVYGLLASYDDEGFVRFWQELELEVSQRRAVAGSNDLQPLEGGRAATRSMIQMLRLELAKVHYGDPNAAWDIPEPLECAFMDWARNPFGAGYHAWAAHYDINDVMQRIRTPARMAGAGVDNVFLIGSAYSNDQAWVEGAFCTAESVLTQYLGLTTIATDPEAYPLICGCRSH